MQLQILNEETNEIVKFLDVDGEVGVSSAVGMLREFYDRNTHSLWRSPSTATLNYSIWISGGENGPNSIDFGYCYFDSLGSMLKEFAARVLAVTDPKEIGKLVTRAEEQIAKITSRS